jgi:hypothetical protein
MCYEGNRYEGLSDMNGKDEEGECHKTGRIQDGREEMCYKSCLLNSNNMLIVQEPHGITSQETAFFILNFDHIIRM